jgi:hypothetical protein
MLNAEETRIFNSIKNQFDSRHSGRSRGDLRELKLYKINFKNLKENDYW